MDKNRILPELERQKTNLLGKLKMVKENIESQEHSIRTLMKTYIDIEKELLQIKELIKKWQSSENK